MINSKEGFEALFIHSTQGILVADAAGCIVKANPACERMFGYAAGKLLGQKVEVLIPKRSEKKHQQVRTDYNHNPHARFMGIGMDLHGCRKDATEFPVEVSLSPLTTNEGSFVIAFIIDITIRKIAEDAIKEQKAELETLTDKLRLTNQNLEMRVQNRTSFLEKIIGELERTKEDLNRSLEKEKELNELKSRFIETASHEFRTPLATILSSLTLVAKYAEKGENEKRMKHVQRVKSTVAHMSEILNDVLSISILEEGKTDVTFEQMDLHLFTSLIIQDLQTILKKDQTISYEHSGKSEVFQDKKILRHILINLISNAIKFSSEGNPICISSKAENSHIELLVKDNGIGIPDDDQKHLFDRFFRGRNANNIQGTGLGLNIVLKYIEMMKGTIKFTSKLNEGTTFFVTLPNTPN
ncbi:MAG TPA: PAS domain-containing sensor histidine kinase [Bacteroidia bacterium]